MAFAVSEGLLAEAVRAAWHVLSIFTASFDLRAAAVWAMEEKAALDTMQALVNASLTEHNSANDRFRLHDLARQFCAGRLDKDERTAALLRHAQHYGAVANESNTLYMQRGEMLRGLELFDRERTHIEAAFDWLQPRGDAESASLLISLVDGVVFTCDMRFHPRQNIRWLEAQRDAARVTKKRQVEGVALGNLGLAYADLGDARKAIGFYEQQMDIAREIGDRRGEGNALWNSALALDTLGERAQAIARAEASLKIYEEIEAPAAAQVRAKLAEWRGE